QATSNDPYFTNGQQWSSYGDASSPTNQYGTGAAEAWAAGYTGSNTVYVGVIDQGVDLNHLDLAANIWNNPFESANGQDDDGNGYKDDIHGWDFVHGDNTIFDSAAGDVHGTMTSGIVGAVGGKGKGVAGVNW